MSLIEIIVLALLQGFTEFLPVSSSAHLLLVPMLTGWRDQGLAFDLALHLGSLAAVVLYFRRELAQIAASLLRSVAGRGTDAHARLGWAVGFATIPVGLAGLAFKPLIETVLRTPEIGALAMAFGLIFFGLLLGLADWRFRGERTVEQMGWKDVAVIGFAQALALIPGTSRSGITMTAGLFLGMSREAASRFSFLLSIPVTALAILLKLLDLFEPGAVVDWQALGLGTVCSAIAAYLCIHYFLAFIRRIGMQPFVIYRLLLGGLLLWLFWP
jgi:undecaprenyl-diphosphatase